MKKIPFSILYLLTASLWGASFTVSSNADNGAGTLRQAMLDANSSPDSSSTITINPGLPTIQLASDLPVIPRKSITITTSGATPQVIDGNANQFRIFGSLLTSFNIQNCTLQNGGAIGGNGYNADSLAAGGGGGLGAGGAIHIDTGQSLTLQNVALINNKAQGGSGGSVVISGGNMASGGGGGASFFSAGSKNASGVNGGGADPGEGSSGGSGTDTGIGYGGGSGGSGSVGRGGAGGGRGFASSASGINGGDGGYCGGGGGAGDSTQTNGAGGGGEGGSNGNVGIVGANAGGGGGGFGSGGAGAVRNNTLPPSAGGGGGGFGSGGGGMAGGGVNVGDAGGGGGGFGGGGGGGLVQPSNPGQGGSFGGIGGNGSSSVGVGGGAGGGGAGIGGAIFIADTATLTLEDNITLSGNTVQGGAGGTGSTTPGTNGQGYANDIFLFQHARLIFNGIGNLDANFNIQSDQNAPASFIDFGIIKQNSGGVTLSGTNNNYRGGTQINGGILRVSTDANLGNTAGGVTFNGGTFEATNTFSSARTILLTGPGTIDVNPTFTLTLSGVVSGGGSLAKSDTGMLVLTGANTYTGGTTINAGILALSGTGALASTGAVTVNAGSFDISGITASSQTIGDLSGSGTVVLGTKTLIEGTSNNTNYAGIISGTGALIKQGGGTLTLTGANTYTGGTTVSAGVLQGNTTSLQGNILDNATVVFDQATTGTYNGILSGSGNLIKQGAGTLTLTEANTYTGGTTVSAGVLQGNTTSLQGNILDNATVVFDQTATGTYNGILSGSGNLIKQGAGTINFTNDSSGFSGMVAVNGGSFVINGKLGGTCTVSSAGILSGTGTIGTLINNGLVSPGSSIGTLTANEDYTQGPAGTLTIEIASNGATSLLQVTGAAVLNGALHVSPEPGVYLAGRRYTFLNAGSVTGQFSSFSENGSLVYTVEYPPNQAQLLLLESSLVIPDFDLSGNARAVADYLFCSSFDLTNTDLVAVADSLLTLSVNEYAQALNKLTPSLFGALPLMELENNFNIVNTFFVTGVGQRSYCYIDMNEPTSIWINPLGFIYSQKGRQEAPGFTAHTYGAAGGMDHLFSDHWSIGLGLGYSHEQLHWKHQAGKAHANSAYLGPYLKYDSEYFYFDFLILGAGNFYDVDRKITFSGFSRKANSSFRTWNISEIILAGVRLEPFNIYNFFIQPELMLDQLNVFQEDIQENKANSIDLSVRNKYSAFLRSLVNAKFVKEFCISNVFVVPSLHVGWLRTTPLTGGHYTAHFRADTFCAPNFTIKSFHQAIDQLLVGAQLLVSCQGDFQFSIGYEGSFGKGTEVNEANIAMRWRF